MTSAPMFFLAAAAEVVAASRIVLGGEDGRHGADVRRLRSGEPIHLTDGVGTVLHGVVAGVRRGELDIDVVDQVQVASPRPRFVVVQALARGGRDEAAVEAMTEVGVDEVIGWQASRSVARWTDRTEARWAATTRGAAKQSRRAWWPVVSGPVSSAEVASRCAGAALSVVLHERASEPLAAVPVPSDGEVVLVVGPEGGVTDDELAMVRDAGAHVVRLGSTVLRSSTAGVAGLAVMCTTTRWR
jgi:16S rRNA (uracil1498-N3)-methyltransferase